MDQLGLQQAFNYVPRKSKIKVLELFGGIGAPRKALENIGLEVKSIDYVEILPQAVRAYNMLFDNSYKAQSVIDWNLNVDVLVHGSPCQDFSTAGLNDLESGRSILYQRTLEIIDKELLVKPKYIVWENVVGLLSKRNIKHFNHYLRSLDELGYKSYYDVLNAKDFGIPQNRERVFVVSIRKDLDKEFNFLTLEKKEMRPLEEFLEKEVPDEARYNFQQPSMIKALENNKVNIAIDSVNTITTKQVRWNNAGIVFRDLNNIKLFDNVKRTKQSNGFHLCEIKKVMDIKEYKDTFRYLTERETWRLMGFDDSDFDKLKDLRSGDLYSLAGNSIVVPVLEAIFRELLFDKEFV